ncbi:MAG: hypothetical protein AAB608_00290 [Patescibacteria group bacterium]
MDINSVKKYQALFKRYKELLRKTSIRAYEAMPGDKINVQNVSSEDLEEKIKVEAELSEGLIFLSDNQLIDLTGDLGLSKKAEDVLTKRKEIQ